MTPELERDLERWERGELSRSALIAQHGEAAASLLEMYERLDSLTFAPVPYEEASWEALAAKLPPHKPGKPIVRVILLAAATVLLLASVAYGTIDPVRSTLDDLIGRRGPATPTLTPGLTPSATPSRTPEASKSPDDDKSDDSSSPGSDDDKDDDNSGPGSGDDSSSSSSSDSSGHGPGDDKSDDNSGPGSGDD